MKAYWGSGSVVPYILDLGTRWKLVVNFTPRPLYPPGKSPWYPLYRRLGGPQSRSGHCAKYLNLNKLVSSCKAFMFHLRGYNVPCMAYVPRVDHYCSRLKCLPDKCNLFAYRSVPTPALHVVQIELHA
jgi:hypothetical protein